MIHQPSRALQRALVAVVAAMALTLAACTGDNGDDQAVAAPGSASCTAGTPAADQQPDRIRYLTAFGNVLGREGYAYVAEARGFFAEQNLEVTIEPGEPAINTTSVVESTTPTFAAVESNGVLIRHGTRQETEARIVSAVQQIPTMSLITLDIADPYGLEGATIGAVAGPAITEVLFPTYAELAGIDESAVEWETLGQPELIPALVSDQVDAIALFLMSRETVARAAGREPHILPYGEYLLDLFGTVHIADKDLAEENPDLVRRFNTAIMRGLQCAIDDPAGAGQIVVEAVPEANQEDVQTELEIMAPYVRGPLRPDQPLGGIDEAKVLRAITVLEAVGQLTDPVAPADVVAFNVVPGGGK